MNLFKTIFLGLICLLPFTLSANLIFVESQQEFNNAHDIATMNDSIVWKSGTYSNIFMDIENDHLFIMAETPGGTIFTGSSLVDIASDYITLHGFQFLNGNIGTNTLINTYGSYNTFTQLNIRAYTCYKYLRVREECQFNVISYCNFENRLNLDDQNILSILVDDNQPGYHKIQYCSFKNFDGTGNDMGIEPIRIGVSTQADFISRTLVEYCYFTQCNGDGEIISSKATQNIYRFNTFEDNPMSELVLRHGSDAIVYGNFFLNGKGGVRVREGQNHYIYNNYFYKIDDRPIFLQNEDSDPLDNIHIAFNTIVECAEVLLGGDGGSDEPTNVTISNNIFSAPDGNVFDDATGTETWMGNISHPNLGITFPSSGITIIDAQMELNAAGFWGLSPNSPAIDAAESGYDFLPQYPNMDAIDSEILFDLMGQNRPVLIADKDLGCNEFPHNILIQPFVTEENTGPSYPTSDPLTVKNQPSQIIDLIEVHPNPVSSILYVSINTSGTDILLEIYDLEGKKLRSTLVKNGAQNERQIPIDIENLPAGTYHIRALENQKRTISQTIKFLKF